MPEPPRAGATLTVDLDAICANWRRLAAMLRPGANCAAVVKADAYGCGAIQVAPALLAAGCRRFGVASLDEGLALAPLLRDADILVFSGPLPGTEAEYTARRLIPVLNSPAQAAAWVELARKLDRRLPAVLHVDTGLTRLGFGLEEARALAEDNALRAAIDIQLVMSHLACAEEPAHPMNASQLAAFRAARAFLPGVEGSLAASSGIFLGADWHADWARPGAALYGINPTPNKPNPMRQVVHLQGEIVQVREIDAGRTVGYGATWRAPGKARLATAALGYADGLPRTLSNRGAAYLGDTRVPIVGRVSMDLTVFDVTQAPPELARPGAMLDLIGPRLVVDEVAETAGTIAYELMTGLGQRLRRVYVGAGAR